MATSSTLHSFPLLRLPFEIIHHILSFFDHPSLETFRQASRFCRTIPNERLRRCVEEEYRLALFEKEKRGASEIQALRAALLRSNQDPLPRADLHEKFLTQADHLHCFTCYSYLHRDQFVKSQRTGRRSYGHSQAMKRFCTSCGFKQKRWTPGTQFQGDTLPCIVCGTVAPTSFEARQLDLCLQCFDLCGQDLERIKAESQLDGGEALRTKYEWPVGSAVFGGSEFLRRATRCTRCWMINHTYRVAVVRSNTAERFCDSCWATRQHSTLTRQTVKLIS